MSDWQKLERDGMVAVVYSPGYGAGWSTWNPGEHRERLIFDSEIAEAVLAGDNEKAVSIARVFCPDVYDGGSSSLTVEWVPKGSRSSSPRTTDSRTANSATPSRWPEP